MQLILWRHADAEDPGPAGDAARDLTKKGRKQAERMAAWLRPRLEGEWTVLSSPANRAVQTVEALGMPFEERVGLDTAHGPHDYLREARWPKGSNTIRVGHQPTRGEVAAILLGGSAGETGFRKGAVWWFEAREREGRTEAILKAVMEPGLLEAP